MADGKAREPLPGWVLEARKKWKFRGAKRPPFAVDPGPGQESVWDYPRPPRIAADTRRVEVELDGQILASSCDSVRILETASPPTFYLPPRDVQQTMLVAATGGSFCEWKGEARYWLSAHDPQPIAWSYPDPLPEFEALTNWFSFYPSRVRCWVDGVEVQPQTGDFYGGWVTPDITGPFKGEPGSGSW